MTWLITIHLHTPEAEAFMIQSHTQKTTQWIQPDSQLCISTVQMQRPSSWSYDTNRDNTIWLAKSQESQFTSLWHQTMDTAQSDWQHFHSPNVHLFMILWHHTTYTGHNTFPYILMWHSSKPMPWQQCFVCNTFHGSSIEFFMTTWGHATLNLEQSLTAVQS